MPFGVEKDKTERSSLLHDMMARVERLLAHFAWVTSDTEHNSSDGCQDL